jgi:hypothetical protein
LPSTTAFGTAKITKSVFALISNAVFKNIFQIFFEGYSKQQLVQDGHGPIFCASSRQLLP